MQPADLAEIEDNDLAQATISLLERIRPYLAALVAALAVIFVGLGAWTLIESRKAAERAGAWDACLEAIDTGDAGRLNEVAARYQGTPAAAWSQLLLADAALASGCRSALTDKQQAAERFQAAAELYEVVMARAAGAAGTERAGDLVTERAMFGLAKAREALGQFEPARRGYEALVVEYPGSPLRELAEERAAALARPGVSGWYDWFGSHDATAAPTAEPSAPAPSGGAAEQILTGTSG